MARQNLQNVTPAAGIGWGAFAAASGLVVILAALNVIPADPASFHAPRWVVVVGGLPFVVIGAAMLGYGIRNLIHPEQMTRKRDPARFDPVGWLVGLVVVGALGLVGAWTAFGPGERVFTGGILGGEMEGRISFGIGSVITIAFGIWGLVYGLRRLVRRARGKVEGATVPGPGGDEPGGTQP